MTTETATAPSFIDTADQVEYKGFWVGVWRRFRRNILAMYGLVFVVFIVTVAVFAPILAPYPYDEIHMGHGLEGPSLAYPLGTDELGRDMLSRIIYGARPMLLVGAATQLVALLIGVSLGIIGGYVGGTVDWALSRLIDFFAAIPWYLFVLYLIMALGPSMGNLILALAISRWVGPCRIARSLTLSVRARDYIDAVRALGIPVWRILTVHVLPQAMPLLLWSFAAGIPTAVFAEAGMSFLGMGVRPPRPSWGQMLSQAGKWWQYRPHMFLFPGLMITASVLAFQGLADGVRTALDVNVQV